MLSQKIQFLLVLFLLLSSSRLVQAQQVESDYERYLNEFIIERVMPWLSDPNIVEAVELRNKETSGFSEEKIAKLDAQWRKEVDAVSKPLIEKVLQNVLSEFLKKKKEEMGGVVTELFVMDAKGLNVGQSIITSDYWQGDEDKWKKTFLVGPGAIFIDKIKKDPSTKVYQAQVSVTLQDKKGKAIGALTLGLAAE